MNTVQSYMARRGQTGAGGPTTTTAPTPSAPTASGSTGLKAARAGTSAISAFSNFAMSFRNAGNLNAQAREEELASRAEYTQANEKSNMINRAYADTIGAQGAAASANGVDIDSGSVQAAGRDAQTDADRQLQIIRNSADMNAKLRLARAASLRASASASKLSGFIGLADDIGSMFAAAG